MKIKHNPLISVIIPYYNAPELLKESINSILKQTFNDFELLVLDDGSIINAEEIITEFNDERIRYIRNKNVGLANNINRSLPLLKGTYIARLDQDDISEPNRFTKQLALFESDPAIDCVFTYIKRFGGKKEWTEKTLISDHKYHHFEPFTDGCMINSTMMVKKEVLLELKGYRQEYYPSDDWDLELRMCQNYRVVVLEQELVLYRFHEGANTYRTFNLMQNTRRWAEDNYFRRQNKLEEIAFDKHLSNKNFMDKLRHWRKDNAKLNTRIAGNYYLQKKRTYAVLYMLLAFLFHPKTILKRFNVLYKK
jgi:glycosyltransferase involved in cell wall biosynthesis